MNGMRLKGGAIIIGSLLWEDCDRRDNWRKKHLILDKKIQVQLPIRYGRKSGPQKRKNTYTMVFSNECQRRTLVGTGWIVPLATGVRKFGGLMIRARAMAKAEGLPKECANSWGAICLLRNPSGTFSEELGSQWSSFLGAFHSKFEPHSLTADIPVDGKGFFTMTWPKAVSESDQSEVDQLDFLLGAATVPNEKDYPTPDKIAAAMRTNRYEEYFVRNTENGIVTFQDELILDRLRR